MQVAGIRNALAHLKHDNNFSIDESTFNGYWKDITDLVDAIQGLGRPYFTQQTAQDLHKKLTEVITTFFDMASKLSNSIIDYFQRPIA